MRVLLTGGAGFIGSHTTIELLNKNYHVIIADNFSNSSPEIIDSIQEITEEDFSVYAINIADTKKLDDLFAKENIDAVIHFAGYKAVGESIENPLLYYRNNLDATFSLLESMKKYHVNNLVFSSSATVYGIPDSIPLTENMPTSCINPYGWTKLMIEQIIQDVAKTNLEFSAVILRYFNPIGAHKSGKIGENPKDIPNNLMPYISKVAVGELEELRIFGDDYPTADGTGVRDFIHVVDLAKAHIAALEYINKNKGVNVFNIGTGIGYSVLDLVHTFEKVNGIKLPYCITSRRDGDAASCFANVEKAKSVLGWEAKETIENMCEDSWHWQKYHSLQKK